MNAATLACTLLLLISVLLPRRASASDPGKGPSAQTTFSANDFDWREMVPYLLAASALPGAEGIKTVLENSKVLRAYVANDVRRECKPLDERCDSSRGDFTMDGEVTRRIDGIVREGVSHQHKCAVLDYPLDRQAFPFSEISALRSDKLKDAYVVIQFADRTYYVTQLRAKYGEPYDTDVFERFSVFKYRLKTPGYTSKAVFEVNPTNGAVMKVAISLKAKKGR